MAMNRGNQPQMPAQQLMMDQAVDLSLEMTSQITGLPKETVTKIVQAGLPMMAQMAETNPELLKTMYAQSMKAMPEPIQAFYSKLADNPQAQQALADEFQTMYGPMTEALNERRPVKPESVTSRPGRCWRRPIRRWPRPWDRVLPPERARLRPTTQGPARLIAAPNEGKTIDEVRASEVRASEVESSGAMRRHDGRKPWTVRSLTRSCGGSVRSARGGPRCAPRWAAPPRRPLRPLDSRRSRETWRRRRSARSARSARRSTLASCVPPTSSAARMRRT